MRTSKLVFLVVAAAVLAGCAAGDPRFTADDPAGFWVGLWHGIIAPIAFIVSLFDGDVEIFERANNGSWYDFGFLFGLLGVSGGGHRSHHRWRAGRASHDACGGGDDVRVTIDVRRSGDRADRDGRAEPTAPTPTGPDDDSG